MRICFRCGKEITAGQRVVADPCCAAPDCEGLTDESHYHCLPVNLRRIEDDEADYYL